MFKLAKAESIAQIRAPRPQRKKSARKMATRRGRSPALRERIAQARGSSWHWVNGRIPTIWRHRCIACQKRVYAPALTEAQHNLWRGHGRYRYRCPDCKRTRTAEVRRQRYLRGKVQATETECDHCGESFMPKTVAQRTSYCSNACRQASYRERKKD